MLKHKYIRVIFWVLTVVAIAMIASHKMAWYIYPLLCLPFLAAAIYGSYFIGAAYFLESKCRGVNSGTAVALSFDDGPVNNGTAQILDVLKREKVQAAFFVIGKNIVGREDLLRRIDAEGHVIGNHSYSHNFWFSVKSGREMVEDLKKCDESVFGTIGKRMKLFRPPYGVTNPMVSYAVSKGNYTSIGWSVRTFDTGSITRNDLLNRTLEKLGGGDIILLHDWGKHTAEILPELINGIRAKGFVIVRPDILLDIPVYY
jgi:peptidoglycan/xylan/chitin deacetylase (PgdA/CDA1 family)